MISVDEARNRILEHFMPLSGIQVPIEAAVGRVLAENISAQSDLPPFSNSGMDGFAVRVADVFNASPDKPVSLEVIADIPAGRPAEITLLPGQAARIMTGAMVPNGAEAIVPVEDTNFNYREPGLEAPGIVQIFSPPRPNGNIRHAGQDVQSGEMLIQAGKILTPQDIGLLCMLGYADIQVRVQPRLAIFSTGDELLPAGEQLSPGKIYDSNSYMLMAQVERSGGIAVRLGIVPDKTENIKVCLERAVHQNVDIIVSSAGVSVGAFDFVRQVVESEGKLDFWQVNVRPGKPLAFGHYKGIPFFGLPGNPVSTFIGYEIFLRPAVHRLLGIREGEKPAETAFLLEDVQSDGRESYLRSSVSYQDGRRVLRLTGHQGSGNLRSLVDANALLIVHSGVKSVAAGEQVDFLWIGDLSGK